MSIPKSYSGSLKVRISPEIHEDIAREAAEKGTTLSGIIAQALMIRRVLRNLDPWKIVSEIRDANFEIDPKRLEADIDRSIKAVRRAKND